MEAVFAGVVENAAFRRLLEHDEPEAARCQSGKHALRVDVSAFQQQLVLAREERVGVGQGSPPVVERLIGNRQMRVNRHEAIRIAPQRRQHSALHRKRHRGEVECGRRVPGVWDVLGSRRHLLVRRATEAMDQASHVALVEEPGAHAGSAEPMYAGQVDSALFQCGQHGDGVVRADQADTPHARPP